MSSTKNNTNIIFCEDYIELPALPKSWTNELTDEQQKYVNRGSCDHEPVEYQLK